MQPSSTNHREYASAVVERFNDVNLADCALIAFKSRRGERAYGDEVEFDILMVPSEYETAPRAKLVIKGCALVSIVIDWWAHDYFGRELEGATASLSLPADLREMLGVVPERTLEQPVEALVCFSISTHSGERSRLLARDFSFEIGP